MAALSEATLPSDSPETTHELGRALGAILRVGDFVGLRGDLGAGKTHFARGVADGDGVPRSEVASPTFAIVYPYHGRVPLFHADLYRLADRDELYATGFFDLFEQGALLVEWIDRIPEAAPADRLELTFETTGDEARTIHAQAFGPRHAALLREWLEGVERS